MVISLFYFSGRKGGGVKNSSNIVEPHPQNEVHTKCDFSKFLEVGNFIHLCYNNSV